MRRISTKDFFFFWGGGDISVKIIKSSQKFEAGFKTHIYQCEPTSKTFNNLHHIHVGLRKEKKAVVSYKSPAQCSYLNSIRYCQRHVTVQPEHNEANKNELKESLDTSHQY